MGSHNDKSIEKHIESSSALAQKLDELQQQLSKGLHKGFLQDLGLPIPSASEADLLDLGMALKYTTEIKMDEFTTAALLLAMQTFSGDTAEIAGKAVMVASLAMNEIFGKGEVSIGVKGKSAKLQLTGKHHQNKTYVAACYASSQHCAHQQWFTATDFYVSKYVFTVFELASKPNMLAALRQLDTI